MNEGQEFRPLEVRRKLIALKNSDCPILGPVLHPVLDFDTQSRPFPALGKILNLSCFPFVMGQ